MSLPIHPTAGRGGASSPWTGSGPGPFHDPSHFTDVFLAAFRRDLLSFYPGSRMEREALPPLAEPRARIARANSAYPLGFQLVEDELAPDTVRVSLFGDWYRLTVSRPLGLGARDRDLLLAMGRVMDLHHQVILRWSGGSLLRLRRGMPEDHYIAACLEPWAYAAVESAPSRIAEAILTLRTMALSTYENRRVTTGALILGCPPDEDTPVLAAIEEASVPPLRFGVELTGLKTLHRLCDGRRTLFLVDRQQRLAGIVDIRRWALNQATRRPEPRESGDARGRKPAAGLSSHPEYAACDPLDSLVEPVLDVPCARAYMFHALATKTGGHACLVLSPNQEIKVFAGGVQAFVFAHGRWRVLDPESKYARWEAAVGQAALARVLFQTALDLSEERQGGLIVVVQDPSQAIGRLIAPHDLLEPERQADPRRSGIEEDAFALESPARPFTLFGLSAWPDPRGGEPEVSAAPALTEPRPGAAIEAEPLTKRSLHYLARGLSVTAMDAAVLESLAGLDGALVTDATGRLLALGAILRHDAHSLPDAGPAAGAAAPPEGARTTAALVASHFGPVLKISQDGIISCFLAGARVWDL